MATVVDKATGLASDSEELLQNVAVQGAAGDLFTVVGHEVDDKVVRSRRNEASKWGGEEVWVVHDRPASVVVGLSSSVGKGVLLSHVVKVLPAAHLEDTNVSLQAQQVSIVTTNTTRAIPTLFR